MQTQRLSVNINEETAAHLRRIAADSGGITITAVVRQIVGLDKSLRDVIDGGGRVLFESADGAQREIVMIR